MRYLIIFPIRKTCKKIIEYVMDFCYYINPKVTNLSKINQYLISFITIDFLIKLAKKSHFDENSCALEFYSLRLQVKRLTKR